MQIRAGVVGVGGASRATPPVKSIAPIRIISPDFHLICAAQFQRVPPRQVICGSARPRVTNGVGAGPRGGGRGPRLG